MDALACITRGRFTTSPRSHVRLRSLSHDNKQHRKTHVLAKGRLRYRGTGQFRGAGNDHPLLVQHFPHRHRAPGPEAGEPVLADRHAVGRRERSAVRLPFGSHAHTVGPTAALPAVRRGSLRRVLRAAVAHPADAEPDAPLRLLHRRLHSLRRGGDGHRLSLQCDDAGTDPGSRRAHVSGHVPHGGLDRRGIGSPTTARTGHLPDVPPTLGASLPDHRRDQRPHVHPAAVDHVFRDPERAEFQTAKSRSRYARRSAL